MEWKWTKNIAHGLLRHIRQQLSEPGLTDDACVYVFTGFAEWSKGNRESDFTETGPCFKDDSFYPPLMELKLKKQQVSKTHIHTLSLLKYTNSHLSPSLSQPLGK